MNIICTEYEVIGVQHIKTLWYRKYVDEGYKGVKSWYDYDSFFRKWMIVIPTNQTETHWSLIIVVHPALIGEVCNLSGSRNIYLSKDDQVPMIIGLDSTSTGINTVAARNI